MNSSKLNKCTIQLQLLNLHHQLVPHARLLKFKLWELLKAKLKCEALNSYWVHFLKLHVFVTAEHNNILAQRFFKKCKTKEEEEEEEKQVKMEKDEE